MPDAWHLPETKGDALWDRHRLSPLVKSIARGTARAGQYTVGTLHRATARPENREKPRQGFQGAHTGCWRLRKAWGFGACAKIDRVRQPSTIWHSLDTLPRPRWSPVWRTRKMHEDLFRERRPAGTIRTRCHRCRGTGRTKCRSCEGSGQILRQHDRRGQAEYTRCTAFYGSKTSRCATCGGVGHV